MLSIPHSAPLDVGSLTASPHMPTTNSIQSLAALAPSPSVETDVTNLSDLECVPLMVQLSCTLHADCECRTALTAYFDKLYACPFMLQLS